MIEIEVQNETHQTQERLKFVAVPRIGEGIRLREPDGFWTSYDVVDLWYQKAEFGDIWVPYLHVRVTAPVEDTAPAMPSPLYGHSEPASLAQQHFGHEAAAHYGHEPVGNYGQAHQEAAPANTAIYGKRGPYPFTA